MSSGEIAITFDATAKDFIWAIFKGEIKNRSCPFCGKRVFYKSFAGAFNYRGELRLLDGSLPCLLALSDYRDGMNAKA